MTKKQISDIKKMGIFGCDFIYLSGFNVGPPAVVIPEGYFLKAKGGILRVCPKPKNVAIIDGKAIMHYDHIDFASEAASSICDYAETLAKEILPGEILSCVIHTAKYSGSLA